MKTTKMITLGLFTLCTMGLSQATFATAKSDNPSEFKFIGKIKNHPVFELNLNNAETGDYLVSIKDENSGVLYSERLKATDLNFTRKYQLDIEDFDFSATGMGVTVEVISTKTREKQVFKIHSQKVVSENITVAKM